MKLIPLTCPSCGAKLRTAASETITCEYCGTESLVQRRVGLLERPEPLPEAAPDMPIAVQRHSVGWLGLVLALPLLVSIAGIGGALYFQFFQLQWQGVSHIMVADVDADGDLDVIGPAQRGHGDVFVMAVDAKSGDTLWRTETVGDYNASIQGAFAVTRGVVLFIHPSSSITAFDGRTGQQQWTRGPLLERVRHVCQGEPDSVLLQLDDRSFVALALADGTTRETAETDCEYATQDDRPFTVEHEVASLSHADVGNLRATLAVRVGQSWLTIGKKARGTSVPMLAMSDINPAHLESGASAPARWEAQIPAVDPLEARADETHVAVSEVAAFAAYELPDDTNRLTAIDLKTGRRSWDVQVERDAPLHSVAYAESRVFVALWTTLVVFDASTGQEVDRIGM